MPFGGRQIKPLFSGFFVRPLPQPNIVAMKFFADVIFKCSFVVNNHANSLLPRRPLFYAAFWNLALIFVSHFGFAFFDYF